jgi:hypothetical protein
MPLLLIWRSLFLILDPPDDVGQETDLDDNTTKVDED